MNRSKAANNCDKAGSQEQNGPFLRESLPTLYKSLLKQAEMFEDDAYMTGVVLLDLHEFYEKQGRHDEAAPVWERIRKILLNGFQQWQKAKS